MHRHHYHYAAHHGPENSMRPVAAPSQQRAQVIEISDDDSDNDSDDESHSPPPPQTRRRLFPASDTGTESSSAIDPNSSDSALDSDPPPPRRDRLHLHKRPKTQHPASNEPARSVKREIPKPSLNKPNADSKPPSAYPKVHLTFPNKASGDDRAILSFRSPPQPQSQPEPPDTTSTATRLAGLAEARARRHDANIAPYYYDLKLELKMYRGPGYEGFPVVLGTVQGHKEICDRWDKRDAKKRAHQKARFSGMDEESAVLIDDIENDAAIYEMSAATTDDEQRCLSEVLQIFPQIQHTFVIEKYRNRLSILNDSQYSEMLEFPTSADIVAEIAELDTFPKEVAVKDKSVAVGKTQVDENGVTIPWKRDTLKNSLYYKEGVILLAREFSHVPTHYIFKVVHEQKTVFGSYIHLKDSEDEYYNRPRRPYSRSRMPRVQLEKKYQFGGHDKRVDDQYADIVNEIQAAKQQVAREALRLNKQKEKEEQEATNLEIHKLEGALVECQCCFDDEIPINRTVSCEGDDVVHFFCFGCVAQLAETQVGSMKHEMCCMDGSGCKAMLSTEGVGQAVSIKVFDRLAFNQQQAEISAAGIEGLEQCPFCDFKAICDAVEVDSVFLCQNPECGRLTCRKCRDDSHLPRSCAEVKADRGLSARHAVEEARSEAMMRPCPKCKVKIVKELGCNKMRCTTCGCIMCYVCKGDISSGKENGYEHFNRVGAKCKLYDQQGVDRHVVEADEAERAAIRKAKEMDEGIDEEKLRVDTKKDDEQGMNIKKTKKKKAAAAHPVQAVPVPLAVPVNQMAGALHYPDLGVYQNAFRVAQHNGMADGIGRAIEGYNVAWQQTQEAGQQAHFDNLHAAWADQQPNWLQGAGAMALEDLAGEQAWMAAAGQQAEFARVQADQARAAADAGLMQHFNYHGFGVADLYNPEVAWGGQNVGVGVGVGVPGQGAGVAGGMPFLPPLDPMLARWLEDGHM